MMRRFDALQARSLVPHIACYTSEMCTVRFVQGAVHGQENLILSRVIVRCLILHIANILFCFLFLPQRFLPKKVQLFRHMISLK